MRRKEIKNVSFPQKSTGVSQNVSRIQMFLEGFEVLAIPIFEYINGFSALTRASPYNFSQKEAYHTANMFWNLIGDLCPV